MCPLSLPSLAAAEHKEAAGPRLVKGGAEGQAGAGAGAQPGTAGKQGAGPGGHAKKAGTPGPGGSTGAAGQQQGRGAGASGGPRGARHATPEAGAGAKAEAGAGTSTGAGTGPQQGAGPGQGATQVGGSQQPAPGSLRTILGYPSRGDALRDSAVSLLAMRLEPQPQPRMVPPVSAALAVEAALHARWVGACLPGSVGCLFGRGGPVCQSGVCFAHVPAGGLLHRPGACSLRTPTPPTYASHVYLNTRRLCKAGAEPGDEYKKVLFTLDLLLGGGGEGEEGPGAGAEDAAGAVAGGSGAGAEAGLTQEEAELGGEIRELLLQGILTPEALVDRLVESCSRWGASA